MLKKRAAATILLLTAAASAAAASQEPPKVPEGLAGRAFSASHSGFDVRVACSEAFCEIRVADPKGAGVEAWRAAILEALKIDPSAQVPKGFVPPNEGRARGALREGGTGSLEKSISHLSKNRGNPTPSKAGDSIRDAGAALASEDRTGWRCFEMTQISGADLCLAPAASGSRAILVSKLLWARSPETKGPFLFSAPIPLKDAGAAILDARNEPSSEEAEAAQKLLWGALFELPVRPRGR